MKNKRSKIYGNSWGTQKDIREIDVKVEIFRNAWNRIKKAVSSSNIEEGGKLLGTIRQDMNGLTIEVSSYIDSGPAVDNSATHLHPDGDYQESMFRILETFDPEVQHIGSWHSHHCNGLDELSQGDIRGYQRSVNNPQYNLDYFFVILIYGVRARELRAKYYLFCRGQNPHYIIRETEVDIIGEVYPFEELLSAGEKTSEQSRRIHGLRNIPRKTGKNFLRDTPVHEQTESIKEILSDDSKWLKERFPSAVASRSKRGRIRWNWQIKGDGNFLWVHYTYPPKLNENETGTAKLEIAYKNSMILVESVQLDSNRHELIEELIAKTAHDTVSNPIRIDITEQ
jgi:hypothetical protein